MARLRERVQGAKRWLHNIRDGKEPVTGPPKRGVRRPGPSRRSVLSSVLWKLDWGKCRYCGAPATEQDHVVPRCNNGDLTSLYNLVMSCRDCNTTKGREGGFTLSKKRVLRRQRRQGLTHLVEYKKMEMQHE